MKKILLLTALITSAIAQAQDYSTIEKLNATDYETAMQLANQINDNANGKYHFYKAHEFEKQNVLKIVFAPDGLTDDQIKAQGNYDNCITVQFSTFMDGKNIDTQKMGVKRYKLDLVKAKYLDIFSTWKAWFNPTADQDKTTTDLASQELRDYQKKIQFYIQKNGSLWTLRNDS